jgi:hypothetical protein
MTSLFLQLGLIVGIADSIFSLKVKGGSLIKLIACSPNGSHLSDDSLSGITGFFLIYQRLLRSPVFNLSPRISDFDPPIFVLPQRKFERKKLEQRGKRTFVQRLTSAPVLRNEKQFWLKREQNDVQVLWPLLMSPAPEKHVQNPVPHPMQEHGLQEMQPPDRNFQTRLRRPQRNKQICPPCVREKKNRRLKAHKTSVEVRLVRES